MSNPNSTEPVQPLTGERLEVELARRLTPEYQRKAVAAYLRSVEAHQAKLVADIDRQAERYTRQHSDGAA